jgi:threonine/homoserine/homoserine lactone efflux protein
VLITFVITTWLLAMLPGVGQALMLRQTLVEGPRAALATIGGPATGLLVWTVGAAAGLSAVLVANPVVYRTLVVGGGAFLAYVGCRTLWSAVRACSPADGTVGQAAPDKRGAFLTGLATNLGNPKAGVFAVSLLPQFAGSTGSVFWMTVGLGVTWSLVTAAWYLVFVALVSRGRAFVTRPGVQRLVSGASGAVLVVLGALVATEV